MIYDVRNDVDEEITEIIFAESKFDDFLYQANRLLKESDHVEIHDGTEDYVRIFSKEHAKNLIEALEKAIDLGWLK